MPKLNPNSKYEQLLHAAKVARIPAEREAWLNLAFYLNQQYTEWHQPRGEDGFIREIPREPGTENHPRVIINKIMHFVRTAQADALQERPTGDVLPPTADYSDRTDARVARAWIDNKADTLDYDSRLGRAVHWSLLGGNGYLKWCQGKDGLMIPVPSFFEIYLDPYAKMFQDCRYIFHSQFMDVEQVYDSFGVEVPPGGTTEADEVKTALLRGMGAAPAINGVVVNELWMKPCRRHPKGLYTVWTGKEQLVAPDKLPYPHLIEDKMLPFTVVGSIERPDSPYHLSPVTYLRPPQMELNAFHNQMLLGRKNFNNLKWFVPEELQLDTDPDDSYNQVLRGRGIVPGLKPEILQPGAPLNNGDGEWIEQGMMHTIGQREVSNAQVPGRVEAAKAIELLKEADADALAVMRKTINVTNTQGWYHAVQLARTFQRKADVVVTYSKEGIPEVEHFMAGKMKPGFRIRTSQTTALARSRANRQDLLVRLWDSKVIQDPEVMADLLDMPMPNTLSARAEDIMRSRNENYTLAKGEAVDANSWDDHATHLQEHNRYRKSSEYQALDGEAKSRFEFHCTRHETLQEVQVARQAKLQLIAQGGQPPQPSTAADHQAAQEEPTTPSQEA